MDDLLVVGPEFDTICEVWISLPHEIRSTCFVPLAPM
jgi:hypothetical protein